MDRDDAGRLSLKYRPEQVETVLGAPLLSVSLPVRSEEYGESDVLPFFDGLLPEGIARERVATRFRINPTDVFGLLREIGRDCAGALSIVPDGANPQALSTQGVEWLDEASLEARITGLAERPLGADPAEGIRISLAGVQDKLVVVADDEGRLGFPLGTTPSTHILKPPSTQRRDLRGEKLAYPALIANEAFCLELARLSGLNATMSSIRRVGGEPTLLIERYDRTVRDGKVVRLHQEDFCQALRTPTRLKYEADGGPGVARYLDLLREWSSDVLVDQSELMDRIAFNFLIGNADAHAKNYALLHGEGELRLAPAYDLVSTHVYAHLSRAMATTINGMQDPGGLQPVHWIKWFGQLGLSARLFSERLASLATRVTDSLPGAFEATQAWRVHDPILDDIGELVLARAATLRDLPNATGRAESRPASVARTV